MTHDPICRTYGRGRGCVCDIVKAARRPRHMVDAIGTARRLRALVAIGYSQTDLARRLNVTVANVNYHIHNVKARRQGEVADRIAALYDQLSMTPGPSAAAMRIASRNGWAPPLAWDENTIDDPTARPQGVRDSRVGVNPDDIADLYESGETKYAIAARFGISPDSVPTYVRRARIKRQVAS